MTLHHTGLPFYLKACAAFAVALSVSEARSQEMAPDTAAVLTCVRLRSEAMNAHNAGDSRKSDALREQTANLWRRLKEFDTQIVVARRTNEPAAEKLMKEKLAFIDSTPGCKIDELRKSLNDLADLYKDRERYNEEEPMRRRLLNLALAPGHTRSDLWRDHSDLAESLEQQGKLKEALPHRQAALEAQPEAIRPSAKWVADALGENLYKQKRYAEAEAYFRQTRNDEQLALALEGQKRWREAEAIWRQQSQTPDVLARLEANLREQGKPVEAVQVAEQALRVQQQKAQTSRQSSRESVAEMRDESPAGKARAAALRNEMAIKSLAANIKELERQGRTADANALRSMMESMGKADPTSNGAPAWSGTRDLGFAPAQAALALQQIQIGRTADAEALLNQSCPVLIQRYQIDLPKKGEVDFRRTGAPSAERCFLELALVKVRNGGARAGTPDEDLFNAAQQGMQTEAGAALTASAARRYAVRLGAGPILDEIDANLKVMAPLGEAFVKKYVNVSDGSFKVQLSQQSNLFAFMGDLAKVTKETQPQVEALNRLFQNLQTKLPEYSNLRNPEAVKLSRLMARSGTDAKLLNADEALVLWMVAPGERYGLVFAISKERSAWAQMGLNGNAIATRVKKLRAQIDPCAYGSTGTSCANENLAFDRQAAFELHQALLAQPEIAAVINAQAVKSLLIVPSGALTTLPPAVLIASPPLPGKDLDRSPQGWASANWLIRKKSITVLPAVSSLASLRGPTASVRTNPIRGDASADGLFMFADPDFSGKGAKAVDCTIEQLALTRSAGRHLRGSHIDRQALAALPPLPCTRIEGERLREQLGGTVLFGKDAREAQVRARENVAKLFRAEVVAFATHGLVSGDFGLGEPALALSAPAPNEGADDGVLTASEITALKLSADVVLLSACNTASPDADDADGLSGLAKAFFHAGASSVLVSHWRVDDAATSALIGETMKLRKTGKDKAKALQQASLEMMNGQIGSQEEADRSRSSHPSIWAPFTLLGEPR
jgi:CHAT domain-containing protein